MFADDTRVSCSHENPVYLYRTMNGSLELLRRWFVANKLTLNVQKTKYRYILFHRLQRRVKFEIKYCPLAASKLIESLSYVSFVTMFIDDVYCGGLI